MERIGGFLEQKYSYFKIYKLKSAASSDSESTLTSIVENETTMQVNVDLLEAGALLPAN